MDARLIPALFDVFVVAQTSSVAEAARRLHKTPSAVSQQIRRVEESFGLSLFERAGPRLRLNASGEAALGAMTRLFDEVASLDSLLMELAHERTPTVRIVASDYLGELLLAPVIRDLWISSARLHVQITTTHSAASMRLIKEGQADIGIVSVDSDRQQPETELFTQSFAWVATRLGRGAASEPVRPMPARLSEQPLLRLAPGSRGRRVLDEYVGRTGLRPHSTIDVPSVALLLSYASQGLGIGLVPDVATLSADRRRLEIEMADVPPVAVHLVTRRTLPLDDTTERLVRLIRQKAQRVVRRLRRLQ